MKCGPACQSFLVIQTYTQTPEAKENKIEELWD